MVTMEKLKQLFADSRKVDLYARWTIRVFIFIGVAYLVFLKDTSRETVFIDQSPAMTRVIVLDHIINEGLKKDSIIQREYYEIPNYDGASSDSLKQLLTDRYKKR